MTDRSTVIRHLPPDFDYSTPEAQVALEGVTTIVLEIRDEFAAHVDLEQAYVTAAAAFAEMHELYQHAERRVALYERTWGFAVIPILIRRAFMRATGRLGDPNAEASAGDSQAQDGPGGPA